MKKIIFLTIILSLILSIPFSYANKQIKARGSLTVDDTLRFAAVDQYVLTSLPASFLFMGADTNITFDGSIVVMDSSTSHTFALPYPNYSIFTSTDTNEVYLDSLWLEVYRVANDTIDTITIYKRYYPDWGSTLQTNTTDYTGTTRTIISVLSSSINLATNISPTRTGTIYLSITTKGGGGTKIFVKI